MQIENCKIMVKIKTLKKYSSHFEKNLICNWLKLHIAVVDKTRHQAYIRPRYRECFGMLIAKLDNIGFAVLSRGLFNN